MKYTIIPSKRFLKDLKRCEKRGYDMQLLKDAVSGTCSDEGKKVYLIDNLTEIAIDSMVVADGKFSFSGSAAKDAFLSVKAEKRKWTTDFFNDGKPVFISVNDSTLTGSPLNEKFSFIKNIRLLPLTLNEQFE